MSAIDSTTSSPQPRSSSNAFDAFSSEQFLELIFTELTNQDPLAPNETKDLLEQIGTIRSIESDIALTERLESIVNQSQIATAGNLVGSYVLGQAESGQQREGVVVSVSVTDDGPVLNLHNNARIKLDSVLEFLDPEAFEQGPGGESGDGSGDETDESQP